MILPPLWTGPTLPLGAEIADPTVMRFKQGLQGDDAQITLPMADPRLASPQFLFINPMSEFSGINGNAAMGTAMGGAATAGQPTVGYGSGVIPFGFGGGSAGGVPSSPPSPPPPPTSANFGALTLRGHGGANLGYTGAGTLAITAGNTGGIWAIDDTNKLILAGTFAAAPPALAGPYSLTISDGLGFTLPSYTVSILANTYHVASKLTGANADTLSSYQLATVWDLTTAAFGQTVLMRDGQYNAASGRMIIGKAHNFVGTWNGSNWFVIRSETLGDPNAPWNNAWPRGGNSAPGAASGPKPMGGGALIGYIEPNMQYGVVNCYTSWQNISFKNINAGANDPETSLASGIAFLSSAAFFQTVNCFFSSIPNASAIPGSGLYCAVGTNNWNAYDNEFYGVCDGIVSGQSVNVNCMGNVVHQTWVRGIYLAGVPTSINYSWNFIYDHLYDPSQGLHGDFFHTPANVAASGATQGLIMTGNVHVRGTGLTNVNGVYADGIGMLEEVNSPSTITHTGTVVKGNFYLGTFGQGLFFTNETSPVIRFNTNMTDLTVVSLPGPANPASIYLLNGTGGNVDYNAQCLATTLQGSQTAPATNTAEVVIGGGTPSLPAYQTAFVNPQYGPAMNTLEAIAAAYATKPGGVLDHAANGHTYDSNCFSYINVIARTTSFPI